MKKEKDIEIVEVDLYQLSLLKDVIDHGEGQLLKLQSGILSTRGCSGDYGCCAKSIDIEQFVLDLIAQVDENLLKKWEK